jgi:phospholipid/cholesterol/gamma-HCH transport system substrate-binding protein
VSRGGRRRKQGPSPSSNVRIAVITLAIVIPLLFLGFTKKVPFAHHYEIKAAFASANNIKTGSPVRIAGVEVGKVTKVTRTEKTGDAAIVTMRVGKAGQPVHDDARAKIRPRIFLEGNFFVDLEPGTPTAPEMKDGQTIPINQTSTPVQFDQVLTALQSDTREDLKTLLDQYGKALSKGGAKAFNRSIPYWKPAYRDTAIVNEASLGETEHDLSGYIANAGATAAALDRNSGQLKSLITDFNTTAAAFAREDDNLRASLQELPNTLHAAMPALASLNASFPPLRAFAQDLRPGVRSSGPALDASIPLVRQLRGLVSEDELRGLTADLKPAVPALAQLARQSIPLAQQGRLFASCQNETVLPWSRDKVGDENFKPSGPVYEETAKAFPGLAGESRSGDANGQWFRVLAAGGTNLVTLAPGQFATTAFPIIGANPPKQVVRPPLNQNVPCETQQPPDLDSKQAAPPPQHKVDTSTALFKSRYAYARSKALEWLTKQLRLEDLTKQLKVSDKDATQQLIDQVKAAAQGGSR